MFSCILYIIQITITERYRVFFFLIKQRIILLHTTYLSKEKCNIKYYNFKKGVRLKKK